MGWKYRNHGWLAVRRERWKLGWKVLRLPDRPGMVAPV